MKYTIIIEEINTKGFAVDAGTIVEARLMAEEKYKTGEFILDPG